MPYCKYCNSRISKFDTDICPLCGGLRPLDDVTSETIDITKEIKMDGSEFTNYKPKRRGVCFAWSATLGIFGAPLYYLGYVWLGILWLFVNLLIIAGGGVTLGYYFSWIYLIVIAIAMYVLNLLFGLFYLFRDNLKSKDGEFVR